MQNAFFRFFPALLLVALSLCLTGMGKKPDPSGIVTIEATSIRDREVLEKNKPFVVTFSAPMVDEEKINKPVEQKDMPIALEPVVAGEGQWLTRSSFCFTATNGYPRGKTYRVALKKDLKALDGSPVQYFFSFRTKAPTVRSLYAEEMKKGETALTLGLRFDMRLPAKTVETHLSVKDGDTGENLPFTLLEAGGEASSFAVKVDLGKYRPKLRITLGVDKEGDPSPLGLSSEYSALVTVADPDSFAPAPASVTLESERNKPSDIGFSYANSYEDWESGDLVMSFRLNTSIDTLKDYTKYIKVEPDIPFAVDSGRRTIRILSGLEPGMQVRVRLLPGLVDGGGRTLQTERSSSEYVNDRNSRVAFSDNGNILPLSAGSEVPVTLTNVDRVTVSLTRVFENNLPFASYESDMRRYGRQIAFKDVPVSLRKNDVTKKTINIKELAGEERGFFYLNITGYKARSGRGSYDMSYERSDSRLVVLTDVGITSRIFPSGMTVFASSLSTGEPLADARVTAYSANNQIVMEGVTNAFGVLVHKRRTPWEKELEPNIITVSKNGDTNFLPADAMTEMIREETGERAYLDKGYEAYLYTPRGVFRPGETVQIKAFVRDARQMPPASFPVIFSVISSRGVELTRGSSSLSDQGGADFSFALPPSSPTGDYRVRLLVPGDEKGPIGSMNFSVEEFVPPRLEVAVQPAAVTLASKDKLPVRIRADYLFGAPGKGLAYEIGWRATAAPFSPEGWDGYSFGDGEVKFGTQTVFRHLSGKLDDSGNAEVQIAAPTDWLAPAGINVLLLGTVQEDSGRWVTQTSSFTYYPTPYLLGLKINKGSSLDPIQVDIAAVDTAGKAADPGRMAIQLFTVEGYWNTIYKDKRYTYVWHERLTPVEKKEVAMSGGKASVSFKPAFYGNFLIRCRAENGEVTASRRFSLWGPDGYAGTGGSGRMDQLEFSLDKTAYVPGDTAKLEVKAPYAGTLFLGMERGEQLETRVVKMTETSVSLDIPVTESMMPNVRLTGWVIRPVSMDDKEWYAHRAYGTAPLLLSQKPYSLDVRSETPARAEPGKPLIVPFSVKDAEGNPVQGEFSAALVDEGILSLTTFKTPSPLEFFMAARKSAGKSYDAYDRLIRPEGKATPLLKPGGGGEESYQGSLSPQRIFLAAFVPTVTTDVDGNGVVEFAVPEYSGKGRLMLVGASGPLFASSASQVAVGRDVEVEISTPRAVAPGDVFALSLKAFALDKNLENDVTAAIELAGPVVMEGEERAFALTSGKEVALKAGNEEGIAVVTVKVTVKDRPDLSFDKRMELAVRSPFPRTSATAFELVRAGKSATLSPGSVWVKGSAETTLALAQSPVTAVLPALEYLRDYPYGCLEQTVSRTWPYLALDDIQAMLHGGEARETDAHTVLSRTIQRLATMQTAEGGFSMWSGGNRPDPWKSVNTTFLLVEAKALVSVPDTVMKNALEYMRLILAVPEGYFNNSRYAYSTKAYAAFVLTRAGQPPLSWIQHLKTKEDSMTPSGLIFIAAAQALVEGNPNALKGLDAKFAKLKSDASDSGTLESNIRNVSLQLFVWSLVDPAASKTGNLTLQLCDLLQKSRWLTTQEAGMASLAIGTYIKKTGLKSNNVTVSLMADGKSLADGLKELPYALAFDGLDDAGRAVPVEVKTEGEGQVYAVYSVRGVPMEAPKPSSSMLKVERLWFDEDGKQIDLAGESVTLKKGQRVRVTLRITSDRPLSDVALSDILPGGMELENPRLKSSAAIMDGNSESDMSQDYDEVGGATYSLHMDARDDRLLLFFGSLSGRRDYHYTMRAVSSGTYVLPPVGAEAMYRPEASAVGATGRLIVE